MNDLSRARKSWERATLLLRLLCLVLGAGCFAVAWHLTRIGQAGIEDVPPPFILVAGLAGLLFSGVALIGRYPQPGARVSGSGSVSAISSATGHLPAVLPPPAMSLGRSPQ